MRAEGAFAASEDADSEGVEGKFYVWTAEEIRAVLGDEAGFFGGHYDVPEDGNWEERIILERKTMLGDAGTEARLADCRSRLLAVRGRRIRPGRDDKILADWNALLVAALARASAVFDQPGWLALAERTFDFIVDKMSAPDGRINHAYRDGKISAAGLIEDQAGMIRAALALYEATAEPNYLARAARILAAAEQKFGDGGGAFFTAAADADDLPAGEGFRTRNAADGPAPSGIGLMAENYARLYHLTGDGAYRAKAEAVLAAYGGRREMLAASPVLLAAADTLENAACVVITGPDGPLYRAALAAADPAVVVLRVADGADLPVGHPAHGKGSEGPAAFVCRGGVCALPVTEVAGMRGLLRRIAQN
jgi:uncharacterized protein YyaL (SSP411 family)